MKCIFCRALTRLQKLFIANRDLLVAIDRLKSAADRYATPAPLAVVHHTPHLVRLEKSSDRVQRRR